MHAAMQSSYSPPSEWMLFRSLSLSLSSSESSRLTDWDTLWNPDSARGYPRPKAASDSQLWGESSYANYGKPRASLTPLLPRLRFESLHKSVHISRRLSLSFSEVCNETREGNRERSLWKKSPEWWINEPWPFRKLIRQLKISLFLISARVGSWFLFNLNIWFNFFINIFIFFMNICE